MTTLVCSSSGSAATSGGQEPTDRSGDGVTVLIRPLGRTVQASPGETLMAAAQRHGLYWPNVCGGLAECAACRVKVDSSTAQRLSPMGGEEADTLRRLVGFNGALPDGVRLACRAKPISDLEVTKRGVRQQ